MPDREGDYYGKNKKIYSIITGRDVAHSSQNTLENSQNILLSADEISDVVGAVADKSVEQADIAMELKESVGRFRVS